MDLRPKTCFPTGATVLVLLNSGSLGKTGKCCQVPLISNQQSRPAPSSRFEAERPSSWITIRLPISLAVSLGSRYSLETALVCDHRRQDCQDLKHKKTLAESKSPSRRSPSRSGLRGFWMRRTPCGPSAARPSPSSTPSSNPPSSTCSATPSPIPWGGRSLLWRTSARRWIDCPHSTPRWSDIRCHLFTHIQSRQRRMELGRHSIRHRRRLHRTHEAERDPAKLTLSSVARVP